MGVIFKTVVVKEFRWHKETGRSAGTAGSSERGKLHSSERTSATPPPRLVTVQHAPTSEKEDTGSEGTGNEPKLACSKYRTSTLAWEQKSLKIGIINEWDQ